MTQNCYYELLAYIIGAALGDGNLSNPNGRATRLRITCDTKYPELILTLSATLRLLLPLNKVSIIYTSPTHINISCYSNKWEPWLGWKVGKGSKFEQNIGIPGWIREKSNYQRNCLKGLIETDGSIYKDRGYWMLNFVTTSTRLAKEVMEIIKDMGYTATIYRIKTTGRDRYNIRVCRNALSLITELRIQK